MIMHDITWGAAPGYDKPGFQPGTNDLLLMFIQALKSFSIMK